MTSQNNNLISSLRIIICDIILVNIAASVRNGLTDSLRSNIIKTMFNESRKTTIPLCDQIRFHYDFNK